MSIKNIPTDEELKECLAQINAEYAKEKAELAKLKAERDALRVNINQKLFFLYFTSLY